MTHADALHRLHRRLARHEMTDDEVAVAHDVDRRIEQLIAELDRTQPGASAAVIEEMNARLTRPH